MKRVGRIIGTLAIIVVLGALLIVWQLCQSHENRMWLEHSVWQGPLAGVVHWADDSVKSLVRAPQLARQNMTLLEQNQALQNEVESLKALKRENEELRSMLKLQKSESKPSLVADVIARDPQAWYAQIVIDKGSDDGVTPQMVAVVAGNLVGRISEIKPHSALVQLISADGFVVPVKLSTSGATGILYGESDKYCRGRYFHRDVNIKDKEAVLTSGLGDIYPEGIVAGYVVSGASMHETLFQELHVKPSVDLATLRHVVLVQK